MSKHRNTSTNLSRVHKRQATGHAAGSVTSIEQSSLHLGPLPHPEQLSQYEQVQPGFAERIVAMTEREGEHRRDMDKTIVRRSFNASRLGMWFGLTAVSLVVGLCFYALYLGFATQAATIAVGVLAALATVFITGRRKMNEPTDKPDA